MLIKYIYIYIYIEREREREREREQRSNLLLVNAITRRAIISFFPLRTNLIITSNKVGTHNNKLKQKYPTTIHNQDVDSSNGKGKTARPNPV